MKCGNKMIHLVLKVGFFFNKSDGLTIRSALMRKCREIEIVLQQKCLSLHPVKNNSGLFLNLELASQILWSLWAVFCRGQQKFNFATKFCKILWISSLIKVLLSSGATPGIFGGYWNKDNIDTLPLNGNSSSVLSSGTYFSRALKVCAKNVGPLKWFRENLFF